MAAALEGNWGVQILAGAVFPHNQLHPGLPWLQGPVWAPRETPWGSSCVAEGDLAAGGAGWWALEPRGLGGGASGKTLGSYTHLVAPPSMASHNWFSQVLLLFFQYVSRKIYT